LPNPARIEAEIQIDAPFEAQVDGAFLREAALATAHHEKVNGPAELTVVVVSDARMRLLNRTYRGIDATTDVLSFGGSEGGRLIVPPGAPHYLGDVIVSYPQAQAQAERMGHPVQAEMQLLVVHGTLHLLGHDHAEPGEKRRMWRAQAEILQAIGAPVANPTPELEE
jgi:probable rRNA maturation factor